MLSISDHKNLYMEGSTAEQVTLLSDWMEDSFHMTAIVHQELLKKAKQIKQHPS